MIIFKKTKKKLLLDIIDKLFNFYFIKYFFKLYFNYLIYLYFYKYFNFNIK